MPEHVAKTKGIHKDLQEHFNVVISQRGAGKLYYFMRLAGEQREKIQQLESRLAQVERERDAAVRCIEKVYTELVKPAETITSTRLNATYAMYAMIEYFMQWRGVCPENSKEGTNEN